MSKIKIANRYGVAPNELLNDKSLSFKAKGLYTYIQSKPDGWDFSVGRITKQGKDGKDSIRSGLMELEETGYLKRHKFKNKKGQWDIEYELSANRDGFTATGNPTTENPTTENPETKKERNSKKEIVIKNKGLGEIESKEWNTFIDLFKPINPMFEDFYGNTTERKALEHIAKRIGKEKLKMVLERLPAVVGQPYAPKITKPTELKRDFGKLMIFMKQNTNITSKYQPKTIH